ncbi:hypothetical protein J1N35_039625 [Gossypium stocksii]|uniref:Uncharacterized protein n=1 Tax=Gossypium stocksii TaxID=47602 RepID=A0A9D3UCL0_9ROSI|nr:hypothetical protein J1N35_039625 [Gossypium stocksii]
MLAPGVGNRCWLAASTRSDWEGRGRGKRLWASGWKFNGFGGVPWKSSLINGKRGRRGSFRKGAVSRKITSVGRTKAVTTGPPSSFTSQFLKEASRLYAASFVRDIGPDLRPNNYKKDDGTEGKSNGDRSRSTETEPLTLEDIAIAARGGMETLRPALQRLYMTRASAYRDALKSFIEGYQEGIQQPAGHGEKGRFF